MPNGVGAMSVRPVVTSPKRRPPPKATRHSSAGGINLQAQRCRPASLSDRRAHQACQPVAGLACRRAHALGLGGRALQPLGRLTKSRHAGSWSHRSSPPSRPVSRHDDDDPGFGLVAPKCQLYRRLYMRTDLCKMDAMLQVSPAAI